MGKLVSRMSDTAKILYGIYLVMTVIEIVLLLAGGMPLFDACIHSFGSAGTGGFSSRNLSVGAYNNPYFEIVIGIFMLALRHQFQSVLLPAGAAVPGRVPVRGAVGLCPHCGDGSGCHHPGYRAHVRVGGHQPAARVFQVSSIITTTGYATVDFNTWPHLFKGHSGGADVYRRLRRFHRWRHQGGPVVILQKVSVSEMRRMLHPNAVPAIQFEGKPLNERSIRGVHLFLAVYLMVFVASCLLVSLEQLDLVTTFTAVGACINNVGPGLEIVGPWVTSPASPLGPKAAAVLRHAGGTAGDLPIFASVRPFHLETAAAVPQAGGLTCLKIKSNGTGPPRRSAAVLPSCQAPAAAGLFSAVGKLPGARDSGHRQPRLKAARPKQKEYVSPGAAPPASGQEGLRDAERRPAGWTSGITAAKGSADGYEGRQVDGGIRTEAGSGETPGPDPDGREEGAPRRSCGNQRAGPRRTMAKPPGPLEGIGQESFQNRTLADGVGDATDPSISQVTTSPRLRKQGIHSHPHSGRGAGDEDGARQRVMPCEELTDDVADIEEHLVRHAVLPRLSVDKASDG